MQAFLDQTLSPKNEAISCGRAGDNRGAYQTFGMGVGLVLREGSANSHSVEG